MRITMETEFLTAKEVATLLRVNVHTIRIMLKDRILPGYKIGGVWRFNKSELLEWIKSGKTERE